MAAAIALAVVLIIAVAGMSLAMQTQRPAQGQQAPRQPRTPPITPRRVRDRRPHGPAPAPEPPPTFTPPTSAADSGPRVPEILRTGVLSQARVVNVVDERVVGPVTRSRLTLKIQPAGGAAFEVTIRHAFPTAEARGKVRIGGTVPVRYDRDEHHKVVLDPDADEPGGAAGAPRPAPGPAATGVGDRGAAASPSDGGAAGRPAPASGDTSPPGGEGTPGGGEGPAGR